MSQPSTHGQPAPIEATNLPTAQILVVDDEVDHAEVMGEALRRHGHVCTIVHNAQQARDELAHGRFDLIVTDLVMDDPEDGLKVLAEARARQPQAETVMVTAHGDIPTATRAVKQGAFDFIEKPLDLGLFRQLCHRALERVMQRGGLSRQTQQPVDGFEGILGNSPAIRRVISTIRQVAPSDLPVLITGENGTGKELIAQAIHRHSQRARKTFKPMNCAGLSESLLETELFGHVRGAFTTAEKDRQGVFEYADGGTLFLDEIGDMPMLMQAKLLRVLECGEVVRVGSNEPRQVDVRFIAATNRDLQQMIREGAFREDLYFRIRGVEIRVPPLRERREDIEVLAEHFVRRFAQKLGRPTPEIADDTQRMLMSYEWPGNVRQLLYLMQNMVVMADSERLEPRHVPEEVRQSQADGAVDDESAVSLEQMEKQTIRRVLGICGGNREKAAKLLGIGERTLYRKLKEYGIK